MLARQKAFILKEVIRFINLIMDKLKQYISIMFCLTSFSSNLQNALHIALK